jgi:ankyrin repeat protein
MEKVKSVFFGHALIYAIKRKDCAVASTLIRSDADVWLEEDGSNALNWAITMENFDAIKGILSAGQTPEKADLNLDSMNLDSLIFNNDYNEMSLLIGESIIGKPVCISKIAFSYECLKNSQRLLKYWFKKVRDINETNMMGHTAIDMCASFGQFETLKLLLEEGADIHRRDKKGHNALYYAVTGAADKRIIKLLLDNGLRLNKEEIPGKIKEAFDKNIAIDRLIKTYSAGGDMKKCDKSGKTACDITKDMDAKDILAVKVANLDKVCGKK